MFEKLAKRGYWFFVIHSLITMMVITHNDNDFLSTTVKAVAAFILGGIIYYFAKVSVGFRVVGGCVMSLAIGLTPSILLGAGVTNLMVWVFVLAVCYVFLAFAIASDCMNQRY